MKINASLTINIRAKEAQDKILGASRLAMRDTVVLVTNDAVKGSPWLTGNNRRSISGEVSQMRLVAHGGYGREERLVNDSQVEGAVYSTSGYGGFLETGTSRMAARPYFRPALDRHFTKERFSQKVKDYLK